MSSCWGTHLGDCLERLRAIPDSTYDSIVTDPPAGIAFLNYEWDEDRGGREEWTSWMEKVARECWRVIKPDGHALVWAIPRTSHWTGWAWEQAGWEPIEWVLHLHGQGFPKNLDVSKALDKRAGAVRKEIGPSPYAARASTHSRAMAPGDIARKAVDTRMMTAPTTPEAVAWDGWGTALKPSVEGWWLFHKRDPNV